LSVPGGTMTRKKASAPAATTETVRAIKPGFRAAQAKILADDSLYLPRIVRGVAITTT